MSDATPEIVSPEHLTDVMRGAGILTAGCVKSVSVESSRQMLVSRVMRLRLEVEGRDGAAPASVFLKTGRADGPISGEAIGRAEVDFYSRVAPLTPAGLLPRCFEAVAGALGPGQTTVGYGVQLTHEVGGRGRPLPWMTTG